MDSKMQIPLAITYVGVVMNLGFFFWAGAVRWLFLSGLWICAAAWVSGVIS